MIKSRLDRTITNHKFLMNQPENISEWRKTVSHVLSANSTYSYLAQRAWRDVRKLTLKRVNINNVRLILMAYTLFAIFQTCSRKKCLQVNFALWLLKTYFSPLRVDISGMRQKLSIIFWQELLFKPLLFTL